MKLVRFQLTPGTSARLGLLRSDQIYDIEARAPRAIAQGDMKALLALPAAERQQLAAAALGTEPVSAADVQLLCPMPNPGKFLAQAANYSRPGAAKVPEAATPWLFCKMTDTIRGPQEPIILWKCAPNVVEEIEVALVIGTPGQNISPERALEHVAGYTICNDVSGRRLDLPTERRDAGFDGYMDWLNGKWLDGFAVLGPAIVTPDEMSPLDQIELVTRVNGEVRVQGSTRDIIHTFAETIAFASRFMTLRTGDVIATGMPHGSGAEIFLEPGDVVEGQVSGLGILRNPVISEST